MDVEIPSSLRMARSTWTHSSDLTAGVLIPLQPGLGRTRAPTVAPNWDETAWMDVEIPSSLRMARSTWTHSSDLMAGVLIPLQPGLGRTRAPTVAPKLGRNSLGGCGDTFLSTYALVNLDPQLRSDGGRAYTSVPWTAKSTQTDLPFRVGTVAQWRLR